MSHHFIEFYKVSYSYSDGTQALKDISFNITHGEKVALLGYNGAGKSTLLLHTNGLLIPQSGTISIGGVTLTKQTIPSIRARVGFVFQNPDDQLFMPTIEEDVAFGPQNLRLSYDEVMARVQKALELVGSTYLRYKNPYKLSGGEKKRASIATVLSMYPDILVLDEPTNGLDPNQILDIRGLIKKIAENRTVILSTHMLTEVQAICDHILMVEQGQLVFSGTIDEFDNYITPNSVFVSLLEAPAAEVLATIPGVDRVEDLGGSSFRLLSSDVNELVDRVVEYSYDKGWRLREVRVEKSSLNAIFAELSKKIKK